MTALLRAARRAVRTLRRAPTFTATAVLTLALGIGANVALFSVVNGVLLEPLPYPDSDALLELSFTAPGLDLDQVPQSPATYLTYREEATTLEEIAVSASRTLTVTGPGEPEEVSGLLVTDGFLGTLRVVPQMGRDFAAADDAPEAPRTILISHGFWQRRFGGAPDVVGRVLEVSGLPREIIGVLPEGFRFGDQDPALFFPAQFDPAEVFMGNFSYQGVGRLAEGATPERLDAELQRLLPVAAERFPGPVGATQLQEVGMAQNNRPLKEAVVGDVSTVLWVLLGTVGIVLLIACANVANLFLARAEGRAQEVAVRTAMGATLRHLASVFVSEALMLALAGGALGTALAWIGLRVLVAIGPGRLPRLEEIALEPLVLLYALGISILAGLAFGLFPLVRQARIRIPSALKEGGRGGSAGRERHRLRNGMVVGQVALALVLLVGSGLMVRSFDALRNVSSGIVAPEELITFRVSIPGAVVEDPIEAWGRLERILLRSRELPGVVAAGAASDAPLDGNSSSDALFVESRPLPPGQIPPVRRFSWTVPGHFEAMGIPLLAGRDLAWDDLRVPNRVVVVSESMAEESWGGARAAIGERVGVINIEDEERIWYEVVGVVGDVRDDGPDQPVVPLVYWPAVQDDLYGAGSETRRQMTFLVRAEPAAHDALLPQIQEVIRAEAPGAPMAGTGTLGEVVDASLARTSFTLVMLGIAAGVALLLGAIGLYGIISYTMSHRTREIGIRMAIGAQSAEVSRMVVGEGMVLAGVGIGIGVVGAFAATRLMQSLLFGVAPVDVPTYGAAAVILAGVAVLASWIPARRAARVDPVEALRGE